MNDVQLNLVLTGAAVSSIQVVLVNDNGGTPLGGGYSVLGTVADSAVSPARRNCRRFVRAVALAANTRYWIGLQDLTNTTNIGWIAAQSNGGTGTPVSSTSPYTTA